MSVVEKIEKIKETLSGLLDTLEVCSVEEDFLFETEQIIIDDLNDIQKEYETFSELLEDYFVLEVDDFKVWIPKNRVKKDEIYKFLEKLV